MLVMICCTQRVSVCLSDGVGGDLLHTEGQCVPE